MERLNLPKSVGDIAVVLPKATVVFKKFGIDFCCGGHRALDEVIAEKELDRDAVYGELQAVQAEAADLANETDFANMESSDLIDYVVNTHHVYLRQTLPELSTFTNAILRAHGTHHTELFQVHKLFHSLKTELEQHLFKEEEILFPLIKQGAPNDKIRATIDETEAEHDTAGDILKELRKITQDYLVPADACGTYAKTYELLEEVESDLFQHIHLENNILFKRFS